MAIGAVIFDKDGTLLDFNAFWLPVGTAATVQVLEALGRQDIPVEEVLLAQGVSGGICSPTGVFCSGTYGQIADKTRQVLLDHGTDCPLDVLTEMTVEAYHAHMEKGRILPACPDLRSLMQWLRKRSIRIALVTADDAAMTKKCLEGLKIAEYFDAVYTDDGTHPNKPDPYCIRHFCETFGLRPEEVAMVGDAPTDMRFARNGSTHAVGVARSDADLAMLAPLADTVLPDVSFLPEWIRNIV